VFRHVTGYTHPTTRGSPARQAGQGGWHVGPLDVGPRQVGSVGRQSLVTSPRCTMCVVACRPSQFLGSGKVAGADGERGSVTLGPASQML
jgi:hypothetical protein